MSTMDRGAIPRKSIRFASLLLVMVMLFSTLPITALATTGKTEVQGKFYEFDKDSHYEFSESDFCTETGTSNTYAPLDPATGKAYQLHHIGQKADGALAVLTESQHQGNAAILNIFGKESEIARTEFAATRKAFWEYLGKVVFVNGGI